MLKIFKYSIEVTDRQEVEIPKGASILCCQTQRETPCLWAIVDPDAPVENRTILMVGTGHEITFEPTSTRYIGTIQMMGGALIFHVFEPVTR